MGDGDGGAESGDDGYTYMSEDQMKVEMAAARAVGAPRCPSPFRPQSVTCVVTAVLGNC